MMIETGVHGTAAVAEFVGPGKLANIPGHGWTDIVGLRRGWGTTFRGVANTSNWFHLAVPTVIASSTSPGPGANLMTLLSIIINFETYGTARLWNVHVWVGDSRIFARDALMLAGDYRNRVVQNENVFQINTGLEPGRNVGISLGVVFGSTDSEILFQGAGASFAA